jgi:hypothetical protein
VRNAVAGYIRANVPRRGRPAIPPETRFWSKVAIGAPDECWPWKAGLRSNGYGKFFPTRTRCVTAHRYAIGAAPIKLSCISATTRACCNPAHLRIGTAHKNMPDMVKGRSLRCRPSAPGRFSGNIAEQSELVVPEAGLPASSASWASSIVILPVSPISTSNGSSVVTCSSQRRFRVDCSPVI